MMEDSKDIEKKFIGKKITKFHIYSDKERIVIEFENKVTLTFVARPSSEIKEGNIKVSAYLAIFPGNAV